MALILSYLISTPLSDTIPLYPARLSLSYPINGIRLLLWNVDAPENIEASDRTRWVLSADQASIIARKCTPPSANITPGT